MRNKAICDWMNGVFSLVMGAHLMGEELVAQLVEQAQQFGFGPGEDYALVDFPDHGNVGDSAIWLGE
ncbi:hypothetical protein, partial [Propionibacterium freudenreichii]|uniref:hypothetical protein n=1 Tax=Propionibacterium freudenreichii TaxID=1744 RepID=UPI0038573965